MNQKSIIIRGGYGYSNFGDDALLYVLFRFLKENLPDASISLACPAAQYIENLLGQPVTFSTTESKCDFFILGGGTQFYWFPFDGKQSSLSKRILTEIKSPQVLFGKIQNRLLKTRPNFKHSNPNAERQIALGIGIGPFSANKEAETQARSMLSQFDHVVVRDIKSISYCDSWNFHQHSLGADICYFPDFYKIEETANTRAPNNVAVVLRDWEHTVEGNKYCEQIELAVKQMRQNGLTVTYVLFAEAQDRYWKSWLGKRNETPLVWQPGKETVSSFMENLNTFDFFVTARYHAAVFGAILNKPAICINIDEKLKLASQLLIPDLPIWNPPFRVDELLNAIQLLTADYEVHRSTLKINTNQQTKLAHKMLHDAVQKITE